MKAKKELDGYQCDGCGEFCVYMQECTGECGKHFCYDCGKEKFINYSHGIYVGGSGDGHFCGECHERLKDSPILNAYQEIAELKRERDEFSWDFDKRRDAAEKKLASIIFD